MSLLMEMVFRKAKDPIIDIHSRICGSGSMLSTGCKPSASLGALGTWHVEGCKFGQREV